MDTKQRLYGGSMANDKLIVRLENDELGLAAEVYSQSGITFRVDFIDTDSGLKLDPQVCATRTRAVEVAARFVDL